MIQWVIPLLLMLSASVMSAGPRVTPGKFARTAIVRAQREFKRPGAPDADVPKRPAAIEDAVDQYYVTQLRQRVGLTDDQFRQIAPMLRLALRERRQLGIRRTRLVRQLTQAVERGAAEDELRQQVDEVDKANSETQASQERFLRSVDPVLSVPQRAKLRVFEPWVEQQIRRMLDRARSPGQD